MWKSNLRKFERAHRKATDDGLIASAQVLVNAVKRGLRGGYTSGDFFTGKSMNSVTWSKPTTDKNGERGVDVGTPYQYPLYWELGHQNLYTGKYERKEVWVPAQTATAEAQARAFGKVYKRSMSGN